MRYASVFVKILLSVVGLLGAAPAAAELKTWDGKYAIDRIEVTLVYFVPSDRTPLPDWRERVDYFRRRIEKFHAREYSGQSTLTTKVEAEPFRSARTTEQLRSGDGDFIYFQTLREVDERLNFARGERQAFPILLVLSDINWRALEDFYRLRHDEGKLEFEGQLIRGRHFPGAASGGARAAYLADRGVGWGLVSADGWRVPYCGSDCVVYHEGVGHTVGLPHPEPGNNSVMSGAQYVGWISESWLDDDQKERLGWTAPDTPVDRKSDLFSAFRALPEPLVPAPGEEVSLRLDWPADAKVRSCRVRIQTDVFGPWLENAKAPVRSPPATLRLGVFDRPTPVSYRVDAELEDGQTEELWGYFQVRSSPDETPLPPTPQFSPKSARLSKEAALGEEIDLLPMIEPGRSVVGEWQFRDGRLDSPKVYGARIEIPYEPPREYRLTVVAEPLDEPNGLILGQRSGEHRFLALTNFVRDEERLSALENIDGQNVGKNSTTMRKPLFKKNRVSQIICTVRKGGVQVSVDGQTIIEWTGAPSQLSLSEYWKTPHENTLFVGAYDCRYRFYRITLAPITGEGRRIVENAGE